MSLSSALSTAMAGLRANQAALSIVSSNVANAQTAGYVAQSVNQFELAGGAIAGAAGEFDLIDALGDIARRLRVGDVGRYDSQRGLVGAQAGHRGGEG